MSPIDRDSTVRMPDDVVFRDLDGEAIILNLTSGLYFGLDRVGTRVWTLLAGGTSVAGTVEALGHEFDVDAATLERDVLELVGDLAAKGLVQVQERGSQA